VDDRSGEGKELSAAGLHLWAAEHYRRLAEVAERAGRDADAAGYRQLAALEMRLGNNDSEQ
jgi:hypothetical protein